ncbi:MAG: THUMP domain-containing protein, partial [Nanoarchaeota archaeon]
MVESCILVRYGEVAVKSARKRPYFERLFVNSIREALLANDISFDRIENLGKMYAVFTDDVDESARILSFVPGIDSYSIATRFFFSTYDELLDSACRIASSHVSSSTFRVTAKRCGKHSFSSMKLASDLGSCLYPFSKGVNLSDPDMTVFVEVRNSFCYVFYEYRSALGGLPAASTGSSLMLFSGGLDSPVAAFEMLKRGCALDFVFVNMVGDSMFSSVSKVYDFLISRHSYNYSPRFFHIDGRSLMSFLKNNVPERLRQIAFKMVLYKCCSYLAEQNGYSSFITGEALSQKSSQTL